MASDPIQTTKGSLYSALAAMVDMFHQRPDMFRLCGSAEVATIKTACDALNDARRPTGDIEDGFIRFNPSEG